MLPATIIAGLGAAGFAGGLVRGSTGFGGALVLAPCSAMLIEPKEVAGLVILVNAFTGLQGFRRYASSVNWRSVVPLALIAVVFTAVFGNLLDGVSSTANRRIIGIVIVTLALVQLSGWKWRHRSDPLSILVAGLFSGAFTAIAGAAGPPAVLYFSGESRDASTFRANLLGYFVILYILSAVVLAFEGRASLHGLLMSLAVVPFIWAGSICGERIHRRLAGVWFERLVAAVLALSGALLAIHG